MPEKLMLQRKRLRALCETEVWKQDIKPFLLEKLTAAKSGIFYDDSDLHWKALGIYAHIEEFLQFVEEIELEKVLWVRNGEKKEIKEKLSLKNLWKNIRKTKA